MWIKIICNHGDKCTLNEAVYDSAIFSAGNAIKNGNVADYGFLHVAVMPTEYEITIAVLQGQPYGRREGE